MSLKYILGRSGCGKTEFCYREILNELNAGGESPLIYIVPEQFSLEAEKEIIERTKEKGMMRAQVLSFQRLAYRIFSEEGGENKKILEDIGKSMLLRKIAHDLKDDLLFYKNAVGKQGFMSSLSTAITEFYKYDISPEKLEYMIKKLGSNAPLIRKLTDLKAIYSKYIEIMKENFITNDETLDLLTGKIKESRLLNGAYVWIDGFHGFTPQELKIMRELLKKVENVTMTLCVDKNNRRYKDFSQTDLFYETKSTYNKISAIADECNIKIEENVFLNENYRLKDFEELKFYEKNFSDYKKVHLGEAKGIKICPAQNAYDEIMSAAREIQRLVMKEGFRYREIGVIVSDIAEYGKIMKGIFNKYDIPCFIDAKTDIMSHPLTELIRAALDITVKNWAYESVFRFLRTGLAGIEREAVDIVENYILAYGIRGGKWTKEWTYGFESNYETFDKEQLNDYRKRIVSSLSEFTSVVKTSKKISVRQLSFHIYALLIRLKVVEKLGDDTQIWSKIMQAFDKIVEILGDEIMSVSEYAKVLDAGLESADMGLIPPTQDRVIIGSLHRSRLSEIKALFVLGVNEGLLPSHEKSEGLLSDEDREAFIREEIDLPGGRQKVFGERLLIYLCLTKPSERLYISYCMGDLDGKAKQPSPLIAQIKKMFPLLKNELPNEILSAKAEFGALPEILRNYAEGTELTDTEKDIYNWFSESAAYKDKVKLLEKFLFKTNEEQRLNKNLMKALYGRGFTASVSQLEQYVECPFAYFIKYMLKARERKLYQIESIDLGTVFHAIIENFFKSVVEGNLNIRNMTKSQIEAAAEDSIKALAEDELKNKSDLMASTPRYGYYMKRIENISKRTIWALSEHIKKGDFEPICSEIEFRDSIIVDLNDNIKMILNGKIDRVDILQRNESGYIKVIDYKSGAHKLDLEKVYYGRQLQLIIYLDALMRNAMGFIEDKEEGLLPAAVFYFRIDNPYIEYSGEMDASKIESEILKQFKMSGLVLNDKDIVFSMDKEIKTYSSIIPVSIDKNKLIKETSSVLDEEQFDVVRNYVSKKARDIGNEITSGSIEVNPIKHGEQTSCDYCPYNSICQFDKKMGEYNALSKFASYIDILEKMKEK